MKKSFVMFLFAFCYLLTAVNVSYPMNLWSDPNNNSSLDLDLFGKLTSVASHAPHDSVLYPERDSLTGLLRLRASTKLRYKDWLNGEFAYEHRARWLSEETASGVAGSFLPSQANAPYRLHQLDWEIDNDNGTTLYRHEIDRAFAEFNPEWGRAVIGRQGIGLGRGVLFSAVDVFSPFSPLEVDREWRRGVDAVRIERRIGSKSSVELIGAFGQSWEQSALLARARGYIGEIDGELIFGKRAEDLMFAGTASAVVGDAEVHGEAAFFSIPEPLPDSGLFCNDREIGKFVAGSSYTFSIGNGLTLLAEYHYSGFGIKDIEAAQTRLSEKDYLNRFLRGDTQILSRHAIASQLSYMFNMSLNGSLLILQSPGDGSGVVSPSIVWDYSPQSTIIGSIFVPWGDEPENGVLKSEYGGTPLSIFIQLRYYF